MLYYFNQLSFPNLVQEISHITVTGFFILSHVLSIWELNNSEPACFKKPKSLFPQKENKSFQKHDKIYESSTVYHLLYKWFPTFTFHGSWPICNNLLGPFLSIFHFQLLLVMNGVIGSIAIRQGPFSLIWHDNFHIALWPPENTLVGNPEFFYLRGRGLTAGLALSQTMFYSLVDFYSMDFRNKGHSVTPPLALAKLWHR